MSEPQTVVHGKGDGDWLAGPVACWYCGHGWVAVRPATFAGGLECPACGLMTGYADGAEGEP